MDKGEVIGKVYFKSEVELIGANQMKKQNLVVETDAQYPQKLPIEFIKEKCDLLNNLQIGQQVKVSVNVRGNEYQDRNQVTRFGLSFQGWKVE
ncbi:DUF3127 domain-containing protein [Flavobacterium sp. ZT3R17]|uniref:DUF3127 domain-containing protein n=1 Tax=Flavobacterium cryoconiti TaxID=3398736 RepID=UPI003A887B94